MKAAVMTQIGKIEIQERPMPELKYGEVLVKVKHCGICGSDMHYYEQGKIGDFVVTKPIVLGHECAGEVVAVADGVDAVSVGDIVALEPGKTCGVCEFCKQGRYNLCEKVEFLATPPYDGAFQEYIAYPQDMVFKLPDGMSTIEGALIEPLSVGFHAAMQGQARCGQSVVILGAGCIGLCTLLALKTMGVNDVTVIDVIPARLEMAQKLGAARIVNAMQADVLECIANITSGEGTDLVFETAGSMITTQQTPYLVKKGGCIVLVGMAPDAKVEYDLGCVLAKEARIATVFRYRNIYKMAIDAVVNAKLPIAQIVTKTFAFEQTDAAMRYAKDNKAGTVKLVITF